MQVTDDRGKWVHETVLDLENSGKEKLTTIPDERRMMLMNERKPRIARPKSRRLTSNKQ